MSDSYSKQSLLVVDDSGKETGILFSEGETLAQAVYLSGLFPSPALCSGLGRCGACRLRYVDTPPPPDEAEQDRLSRQEIDAGWRLGCRRKAAPGVRIELPLREQRRREVFTAPAGRQLLAVDLGTTSMSWRLFSSEEGVSMQGKELNPQLGAGAEIMSRLAYASIPAKARQLQRLVADRLVALQGFAQGKIGAACVAANPAMTLLLLGKDVSGLAAAPYRLEYCGGGWEDAPGLGRVYAPPFIAPFVGGDVSAGLAWLHWSFGQPAYPYVLADLGTNGEIVLAAAPDEYVAASVAMGPALEGVGMTYGGVAGSDTAVAFELTPNGLQARTPSGGQPKAVSGTGYVSLLAALRRCGAMNGRGGFELQPELPLGRIVARRFKEVDGKLRLDLGHGLALLPRDVEQVLQVKAAFALALARVLETAGVQAGELSAMCLSGALGEHLPVQELIELGFVPPVLASRVVSTGNTSLEGATLLLQNQEAREWIEQLVPKIAAVNLASEAGFDKRFIASMTFDWLG